MAALESEVQSAQPLNLLSDYQFSGNPFTVERKCKLIVALREHGSIYHAAEASGCSRRAVYDWIEQDEQFALAVEHCKEDSYDDLEASVYKRAFKSDLLAMFYLKAHRHKFRDKIAVDITTVQSEIEQRFAELNLKQLPPAITQFIDTVESGSGYEPVPVLSESTQFASQPDSLQKEVLQPEHNLPLED